jgi:hypothetical protein
MRFALTLLAIAIFLYPATGRSAGVALTGNFNVLAPNETLAETVAEKAETYRKQAAREWLGKDLPEGQGRTMITVIISTEKVDGLTWPIDCPERKFHQIWTTTSEERAAGEVLHHEVVHTVLDTFSGLTFLPAWANEGIASQVDEAPCKESRRQIALRWTAQGQWPQLRTLFQARQIAHTDREGYAAAASVTEFLATLQGKPNVVRFAQSGQQVGWDQAARDCYGAHDVDELQVKWQTWVRSRCMQNLARNSSSSATSAAASN